MPLIYDPEMTQNQMQGEGWIVLPLAGHADVGSSALVVRRWSLQAGARTPKTLQEGHEEMLYVIRGSGEAIVGEQNFELRTESMLWLEPGDSYELIAGETGLEILQGYAGGD